MSTFTQRHFEIIADSLRETAEQCRQAADTDTDRVIVLSTMYAVVNNLAVKFAEDNQRFKSLAFKERALG